MNFDERMKALERQTAENGKTITRVFEAIYGNGKPGLLLEFHLLRQSVEKHHREVEERRKEHKLDWQWIITTIIAAAAIAATVFK